MKRNKNKRSIVINMPGYVAPTAAVDAVPETTSTIVRVTDSGQVFACDVTEISSLFSKRTTTPEGFLKMPATLARTGVQTYLAKELGLDRAPWAMDSMRQVKLLRPAEEVFAPDSMASFENQTLAIDHPGKPVTADNWKAHAVGEVRDIQRVGDTMGSQLLVKDKSGIDALQGGKKYLSNGYDFLLDMTPGTTSAGDAYDGVQRQIRGNHVALVDNPRGGPTCKVADSKGEPLMKVIMVDGIPVNVDDQGVAVLDKFIASHAGLIASAATTAAMTLKIGDKAFKLTDPTLQSVIDGLLTPDQVDARVAARQQVVADAIALVPTLVITGKDSAAIQREVVTTITALDSASKNVVDAMLAGTALDKASTEQLSTLVNVLKATATTRQTTNDSGNAFGAAILSTTDSGTAATAADSKVPVMLGRQAFIDRTLSTDKK